MPADVLNAARPHRHAPISIEDARLDLRSCNTRVMHAPSRFVSRPYGGLRYRPSAETVKPARNRHISSNLFNDPPRAQIHADRS